MKIELTLTTLQPDEPDEAYGEAELDFLLIGPIGAIKEMMDHIKKKLAMQIIKGIEDQPFPPGTVIEVDKPDQ